ncbi:MAG: GspE/PulE family protein [Dehalococcoidia bacterium]
MGQLSEIEGKKSSLLLEADALVQEYLNQAGEGESEAVTEEMPAMAVSTLEPLEETTGFDLPKHRVQDAVLRLIPEAMARKYLVVPLEIVGDALAVAMADPENLQAIQDLEARADMRVEPVSASPQEIQNAIDRNYRAHGEIERELSQVSTPQQAEHLALKDTLAQSPMARAVDLIISQAVRDRASDIHIEPQEDRIRVRYRIDGVMHEMMSLSISVHAPVVSRIKILGGMNIAERRRPQDGQISVKIDSRDVDIRVASCGTVYGEMLVLRLLDKEQSPLFLSQLGLLPDSLEVYRSLLTNPYGVIMIAGPTGAGKTTTLYASINELDKAECNIVTIEDPVEYRFLDINQIQVNPKAGITFANGLRAVMRLDPDVILIGEIRDSETAEIAMQAALTGHLVLCSIHANDAAGALFRLIDLGVEPHLIASALMGVVAQRMVRRICPSCSKPYTPSPEALTAYENELSGAEGAQGPPEDRDPGENGRGPFSHGTGCEACAQTGFLGRVGVFEIMTMSDSLRHMLVSSAIAPDVRLKAVEEGMTSMRLDGMLKVKEGVTTTEEVVRNIFTVG